MTKARAAEHTYLCAQVCTPELWEKYLDTVSSGPEVKACTSRLIRFNGFQKGQLPPWIEFRQHVIQQQERRVSAQLTHQPQFGQLEGQHDGSLLTRRTEATRSHAVQDQLHLIAVGTHPAASQSFLFRALSTQLLFNRETPGFSA